VKRRRKAFAWPDVSRYVDAEPGIARSRHARGFRYVGAEGTRVSDGPTLARIRALAIPPAWTDVWICGDDVGHLQATGRDARGRKQYRYHPAWSAARDDDKFERLLGFGEALPRLRRRVARALDGRELSRERVLAAVVRLLDTSYARVGNREYRRTNGSFGLTTLERGHARASGRSLTFRGKSGVRHEIDIDDPRLARVVRRCQSLPGQALFRYLDDGGEARAVDSEDVNEWLREASGRDTTAKEFRTWHGSALALDRLRRAGAPATEGEARAAAVAAVDEVARRLGNTRAVCRRHYVHPALFRHHASGRLHAREAESPVPKVRGLAAREARLLAWLRALETGPAAESLRRAG
jgi:DNA topoisomerase-1